MRNNNTKSTGTTNKTKWILKRIFVEYWFAKLGAVVCGVLLWLCLGYLL